VSPEEPSLQTDTLQGRQTVVGDGMGKKVFDCNKGDLDGVRL
jgi:hypothetical protein